MDSLWRRREVSVNLINKWLAACVFSHSPQSLHYLVDSFIHFVVSLTVFAAAFHRSDFHNVLTRTLFSTLIRFQCYGFSV